MEALKEIQSRFYRDFPAHPKEQVYEFATPSTMKPTQWFCKFVKIFEPIYIYLLQLFLRVKIIFSYRSRGWNQSNSW